MGKRRDDYELLLKHYFKFDKLKDEQFRIIDRIVCAQKDVLAILATGFGKSVCYQLPYLITKKTVFVVSPLLALMEDQHTELKKKNIPSCCLNSTNDNKRDDYKRILNGENMIIYTTPEYFVNCEKLITNLYENNRLCCIAIDECHCVSSWSDESFRADYKSLNLIREWAAKTPIIALTATASQKVQDDIIKYLKLDKYRIIKSSFDRKNLYLAIHPKSPPKQRLSDILPLVKKHNNSNSSTIIYTRTRKNTEKIADELSFMGIKCLAYHAGMDKTSRSNIQQQFMTNKVNCIVATIAFGMGIDNRHVRLVIHYGSPFNLESYYQEIGRAGRDGNKSECHLFYGDDDYRLGRFFAKEIEDEDFKKYNLEQIAKMEHYVHTKQCRRKMILNHFGEMYEEENCQNCDMCLSTRQKEIDITNEATILFSLISDMVASFGTTMLIKILRGSNDQKIIPSMKKLKQYGAGKHKTEIWWKDMIRKLIVQGYLHEETLSGRFGGSVLSNTMKTNDLLKSKNKQAILIA